MVQRFGEVKHHIIFPGMLQEEHWQISAASMTLPQNSAQQGMSGAVPRYCHCGALSSILYRQSGPLPDGYTVAVLHELTERHAEQKSLAPSHGLPEPRAGSWKFCLPGT